MKRKRVVATRVSTKSILIPYLESMGWLSPRPDMFYGEYLIEVPEEYYADISRRLDEEKCLRS